MSAHKVVGTPNSVGWSQVHSFTVAEDAKNGQSTLTVVVSLQKKAEESISNTGKNILSLLQDEYFKKVQDSTPFIALKESLESVWGKFCQDTDAGLDLAASVVWEKYLYFGVLGRGRIAAKRDTDTSYVLLGENGRVSVVSGLGQEGDIFILGTADFFKKMPLAQLGSYLGQDKNLEDATDEIVADIPVASSPLSAAALFKFTQPCLEEKEICAPIIEENKVKQIQTPKEGIFKKTIERLAAKLPERETVILKDETKSRRMAVSVGIVLLLLLASSIIFGVKQKKIKDYKLSYESDLVHAQTIYNDSLSQVNTNPPQARSLFIEAKSIVDSLVAKDVKDPRLDGLKNNLENDAGTILGKVDAKVTIYRDFSVVRSGIIAAKIALDKNKMAILDTGGQRIIAVSATNKETEVVAGPEKIGSAESVAVSGKDYYVFSDKGVVKVKSGSTSDVIIKPDTEWGNIVGFGVFEANFYLIDKQNGIWRYQVGESGVGSKQKWLKEGVTPDLAKTTSIAIDGSIWVLSTDGQVTKFTRGVQDAFRITGLDKKLNTPVSIYTDGTLDNFYILDKGNSRIVEISKTGEFKKEYTGPELGEGVGLVVYSDSIFLITPNKLFEIKL